MALRRRLWLLAPAAVLAATDAGLTLAGQPPAYWAGDPAAADEANPLARPFLADGPAAFAGFVAASFAAQAAVVLVWRHPISAWLAMAVAAAHAVGAAGWLVRAGPWGWPAAALFLAAAAEGSAWCWRRAGRSAQ